jgi:hypothetical protein
LTEHSLEEKLARCAEWPAKFSPEEWSIYRGIIRAARERGIPFAVGGGLAAMTYADQWRNTKDLDLYALYRDREWLVQLLTEFGLADYYEVQAYDRKWIYRAHRGEVIVDVIWAMANQRAQVDESWLRGPEVEAGGERFRLLGAEEAIWSKLYVLQRDRSDWPDCLNVLYGVGPQLDWQRLIVRLGDDLPLLSGLVSVFVWLAPQKAQEFPGFIWDRLRLPRPQEQLASDVMRQRAAFLDTRPWFTPCK